MKEDIRMTCDELNKKKAKKLEQQNYERKY